MSWPSRLTDCVLKVGSALERLVIVKSLNERIPTWKAYFAAGLARQSHVTGIVQSDYAAALAGRLHFSIYRRNVFGMLDKI